MTPNKILIIAHFYEPCNVIAAHRPKSWAKALQAAGYEPVILTRHWTGNEANWDELLSECTESANDTLRDGIRVIELPYRRNNWHKIIASRAVKRIKILRFGLEWLASCFGRIEVDRDINAAYFQAANELLHNEQFKLLIVTTNPYTGVRLTSRLAQEHGLPWLADFRDLWDVSVQLQNGRRPPLNDRIRYRFYNRSILKWLRSANGIITCSEAFELFFAKHVPHVPQTLVKNGFEAALFRDIPDTATGNDRFTILCTGTLYPQQDLKTVADGVKRFLTKRPEASLRVRFLGVQVNPVVTESLHRLFPSDVIETTDFVPRATALREMKHAHVLFYPVWKGYTGIYSGKFFEYLGAGKNILIAPDDAGVLRKTLRETAAGVYPSTPEAVAEQLEHWYAEWEQHKTLTYHGIPQEIARYTRESQARQLVELTAQFVQLQKPAND